MFHWEMISAGSIYSCLVSKDIVRSRRKNKKTKGHRFCSGRDLLLRLKHMMV
jgi:hypothetical protein